MKTQSNGTLIAYIDPRAERAGSGEILESNVQWKSSTGRSSC